YVMDDSIKTKIAADMAVSREIKSCVYENMIAEFKQMMAEDAINTASIMYDRWLAMCKEFDRDMEGYAALLAEGANQYGMAAETKRAGELWNELLILSQKHVRDSDETARILYEQFSRAAAMALETLYL